MRMDYDSRSLKERFDHLVKVVSSDRFLKKMGLGNEVPFFICPFRPEEAVDMQDLVDKLASRLQKKGVTILQINLYDLCLDLLQKRGVLEQILEEEQDYERDDLMGLLDGLVDPEKYLAPSVAERMKQVKYDVIFITGIGEVYPYLRPHKVLNNLHKVAKREPTVTFFPGQYTQSHSSGSSLDLFGRMRNDLYYRAFNILKYEV